MSTKTETDNDTIRRRSGGRLAHRARSFKRDFFDKLNQIRSPSATRSPSPNKPYGYHKHHNKSRNSKGEPINSRVQPFDNKKSSKLKNEKDVNNAILFVKQLTSALRYFQDVVEKDKLEQLPGSASVLLEIVLAGYSELKAYLINYEQSSLVISATNQVYQSLAELIRWSDTVLIKSDKSLDKESVGDIVRNVQEAVHTLVQLCIDRYQNKDSIVRSDANRNQSPNGSSCESSNTLKRLSSRKPENISISSLNNNLTNSSSHRNSLPEIPLSPREKEILESTNFATPPPLPFRAGFIEHLNHSLSSDSILNSTFCTSAEPPPKPPLPVIDGRPLSVSDMIPFGPLVVPPPPLPPKKYPRSKNVMVSQTSFDWSHCESSNCTSNCNSMDSCLNYSGLNHLSADDLLSMTRSEAMFDFKEQRARFDSYNAMTAQNGNAFHNKSHKSYEYKSFSQTRTQRFHYMNNHSSDVPNSPLTGSPFQSNRIDSLIDQMKAFNANEGEDVVDCGPPPQLPVKLRPKLSITSFQNSPNSYQYRPPSEYDNISNDYTVESPNSSQKGHNSGHELMLWHQNNNKINICPHSTSCPHFMNNCSNFDTIDSNDLDNRPPPLPPKKRNIMAYMQMVDSYNGPVDAEFYRHSVHTYQLVQSQWQQVEMSFCLDQRSVTTSFVSASSDDSVFSYESEASLTPPPLLPPKKSKQLTAPPNKAPNSPEVHPRTSTPISLVPSSESGISSQSELTRVDPEELQKLSALDEIDVSNYIIHKNATEEGPEIRGGTIDSLIVKATEVSKNDFMFQEAFLTTYRTLLTPMELINKLLYRYNKFILISDMRQRAARNAFALLVRVVDDMCIGDCHDIVLQNLMDFVYQLVNRGDLALAKVLRAKCIEKMDQREALLHSSNILLPSISVTVKQSSLLDFKSEHLAEQMTLLDSKLFLKIEIPEVLVWAKEQKEELIPNLNTFTEHFNKMSYWTRSRILEHEEAKERERLVMKFIKIMKHLRKLNNFNSYLAILSALDSAPIRRLEWQRSITEGLKEYSALIDSSSSFRAYRQALSETDPPCIPYIGLILQDLTFVHIGNNDFLPDGNINFAKRWQQYNILDQMRRFKNCHYQFKRNEQIIAFFNNFDNYLSEEAMWQISEAIKPRGVTKK